MPPPRWALAGLTGWSVSFFGGVGGYGVAHYLPLDGTVFRDSRSVDSKSFVGTGTVGISVRHHGLVLSLSTTFLSDTFETQRENAKFGTFSRVLGFVKLMNARTIAILAVMLLSTPTIHAGVPTLSRTFKSVGGAVVLVRTTERMAVARRSTALEISTPGIGSGVLISADGKVLTAAHVVQTADAVAVEFPDGVVIKATVLASEPAADLALLQLERVPAAVKPAVLGDSDKVEIGDEIFIVGAPLRNQPHVDGRPYQRASPSERHCRRHRND